LKKEFILSIVFFLIGYYTFFILQAGEDIGIQYFKAVGAFLMAIGGASSIILVFLAAIEGAFSPLVDPIVRYLEKKYRRVIPQSVLDENTFEVTQRVKLEELENRLTKMKLLFRLVFAGLIILSVSLISANLILTTQTVLSILTNPSTDILQKTVGVVGNVYSSFFFLAAPASMIVLYFAYKKALSSKNQQVLSVGMDDHIKVVVEHCAKQMNLRVPRLIGLVESLPDITATRYRGENALFVTLGFINHFRDKPRELKAAIIHELMHIKNGDIDDKTRIAMIRDSILSTFNVFTKLTIPFVVLFPFSLAFTGLGLIGTIGIVISALLFFVGLVFLFVPILPILIAPFLVGAIGSIFLIPIALILGKINQLMETRADIGAAVVLKNEASIASLLHELKCVAPTAFDAVKSTVRKLSLFEDKPWKEHIYGTPGIIMAGAYDYCLFWQSNVSSRLAMLEAPKVTHFTKKATIEKFRIFIGSFFRDMIRDEGSRIGLVLGLLFSPFFYMIAFWTFLRNPILCFLLTFLFVTIFSKGTKYVLLLLAVISKALNEETNGGRVR
jgi:Zn-dependent protease with chaperone function